MWHLDTNIVVAYLNGNQTVSERLQIHLPDVSISSLVFGELLYGVKASQRVQDNLKRLKEFAQIVKIVDFDRKSAEAYSQIRLALRQKGRPTGEVDILIAAIAIANNAILVTGNTKHFQHIDDLKSENWIVI